MTLLFKVRGHVVPADGVQMYADPAKPKVAKEREAQHLGFLVEGFPPDYVAMHERMTRETLTRWLELDDGSRRRAISQGRREPKPWDLDAFLRKTKRKRVLHPYAVPEAAEECRALAEKSGWTHLVVTELIREAS